MDAPKKTLPKEDHERGSSGSVRLGAERDPSVASVRSIVTALRANLGLDESDNVVENDTQRSQTLSGTKYDKTEEISDLHDVQRRLGKDRIEHNVAELSVKHGKAGDIVSVSDKQGFKTGMRLDGSGNTIFSDTHNDQNPGKASKHRGVAKRKADSKKTERLKALAAGIKSLMRIGRVYDKTAKADDGVNVNDIQSDRMVAGLDRSSTAIFRRAQEDPDLSKPGFGYGFLDKAETDFDVVQSSLEDLKSESEVLKKLSDSAVEKANKGFEIVSSLTEFVNPSRRDSFEARSDPSKLPWLQAIQCNLSITVKTHGHKWEQAKAYMEIRRQYHDALSLSDVKTQLQNCKCPVDGPECELRSRLFGAFKSDELDGWLFDDQLGWRFLPFDRLGTNPSELEGGILMTFTSMSKQDWRSFPDNRLYRKKPNHQNPIAFPGAYMQFACGTKRYIMVQQHGTEPIRIFGHGDLNRDLRPGDESSPSHIVRQAKAVELKMIGDQRGSRALAIRREYMEKVGFIYCVKSEPVDGNWVLGGDLWIR